jgi:hypothetical protein
MTETSSNGSSKRLLHFRVPFHGAAKLKHIPQRPKHMKREEEQRRASSLQGSGAWGRRGGWSRGGRGGAGAGGGLWGHQSWSRGRGCELPELELGAPGRRARQGRGCGLLGLATTVGGAPELEPGSGVAAGVGAGAGRWRHGRA